MEEYKEIERSIIKNIEKKFGQSLLKLVKNMNLLMKGIK